MTKPRRYILIAIVITFTILLLITAVLPLIIRSKTISAVEEATGRNVRLETVLVNPFTLTVTARGFSIDEQQGSPLVSLKELKVTLAVASIIKRAFIVSRITIDSPAFSFARHAPNIYSFSDIIDHSKASRQTQRQKNRELLFSINNITIKNGSIDFLDRVIEGGRRHTVRALELNLPFISNIPYLVEQYTAPRISAMVNGAPFQFAGQLKPLSKSMESSVHIKLQRLNLPEYLAYSPFAPPADLASGRLTLDTDVSYRISAEKSPELALAGTVKLEKIVVNTKNDLPLLRLPLMELKAKRVEVFHRIYDVEMINAQKLDLHISRNQQGEWFLSRLIPPRKEDAGKKEEKPGGTATVRIGEVKISDSSLHVADALPSPPFRTNLQQIDLALKNFSTAPDKPAEFEMSMAVDDEADLSAEGTVVSSPLKATTSLDLSGYDISRAWPYLSTYLTAPLRGELDLSANFTFDKDKGVDVQQALVRIQGLTARYGNNERLQVADLKIENMSWHQRQNRVEASGVRINRPNISLSRQPDGSYSPMTLLKKVKTGKRESKATRTATKVPLSYLIKRVDVEDLKADFTDRTKEENPRFALTRTSLKLTNLTGPKYAPAGLTLSTVIGKQATVKADGQLTPAPFRYKGKLNIRRLPLADFESYLPENLNIELIAGFIDTNLGLDLAIQDKKIVGNFKGSAGVRGFHCLDSELEQDLLKWESLQIDQVYGNLSPFNLNIHEVALNNAYSRIIVRKDGSLNLQNLVEKEKTARAETSSGPQGQQQEKGLITIGTFTVQDGTLAFTDNHLRQPFSTTFYNLGGRISGLTSEEAKFAEVDLRGNLENQSPLQITGRINPLRKDLFVDVKVSFNDIELSPVTPYSGTYLGYAVDKGKLFLDLRYLIDRKQLNSENKVFIDQLTLGRKIISEKATSLPVRLAVALLKDRRGEIHLDLPVAGRTDDPEFSVMKVIGQMLKNIVVKAATSPFALLGSLMHSGQDFSAVMFTPGSSKLSTEAEKKLDLLAKALHDRPGLKVEIKAYIDDNRDPEGYRYELLKRRLKNEKFLALAKEGKVKQGETADSMVILADEHHKYLKAVYNKERFPKPRNFLGLVKDLSDNEMTKLIVANTMVGENELQTLARDRASNVMNYLVRKGGLPPERLFQKNDDIRKPPEKSDVGRSRVEFNAIA